jgi:hypothetical protein
MSTGTTKTETPPTEEEQQKALWAKTLEDMEASELQFQDQYRTFAEQAKQVREEMLSRFRPQGSNQLPPEIQEIVVALTQTPRLIAPTKQFIMKALTTINTAVDGIIEDL